MLDPTTVIWGFVGVMVIIVLATVFLKNRTILNFIGLAGSIYCILAGVVLLAFDRENSYMFVIIGGFIMAAIYLKDITYP